MVDLTKFKISNLIKFFKTNYNNFSGKDDENNLKKIISEIPWFNNDFKKEKLITKNDYNYKKCLEKKDLQNLMELSDNQLLSNLRILNILIYDSYDDEIFLKDVFPNLFKLKVNFRRGVTNISYSLLNRIKILSLNDTKLKIDTKNKEIELLSLKSLKLVDKEYFNDSDILFCKFPN